FQILSDRHVRFAPCLERAGKGVEQRVVVHKPLVLPLARLLERDASHRDRSAMRQPDRESATFVPIESLPVPYSNTPKQAPAKKLCLVALGSAGAFQRVV